MRCIISEIGKYFGEVFLFFFLLNSGSKKSFSADNLCLLVLCFYCVCVFFRFLRLDSFRRQQTVLSGCRICYVFFVFVFVPQKVL